MKFIVGSLIFKPGTRDEVLSRIQPLVAEIRREPRRQCGEFTRAVARARPRRGHGVFLTYRLPGGRLQCMHQPTA